MIDYVCGISISLVQIRRIQAVDILRALVTYQKQVWKIERVCLRLLVKRSAHGRVNVHFDLIEGKSTAIVGFDRFRHGELGCELNRSMACWTSALEDKCG